MLGCLLTPLRELGRGCLFAVGGCFGKLVVAAIVLVVLAVVAYLFLLRGG